MLAGNKYDIFNCDGIDIDSSQNVCIVNLFIASQDDCISAKSGRNEEGRRVGIPSKNVTIENFTFKNTHSIASIKAIRGRGHILKIFIMKTVR